MVIPKVGEFAKRAFMRWAPFFAAEPDVSTFRLSFATADIAKIEKDVERLSKAL